MASRTSLHLAWGLALLAFGMAGPAAAQLKASAGLETDSRLRGISVSARRPALALNLGYDFANGLFVGGSVIAQPSRGGLRTNETASYIGYAGRLGPGRSWDIGVNEARITGYEAGRYARRYSEVFAGVTHDDLSLRLYYSPHYYDRGARILYLDLNDAIRPADNWRLFAHAGVLMRLASPPAQRARGTRYDLKAGVARNFGAFEVHAAVAAAFPIAQPRPDRTRPAITAGASYFF